MEGDLKFYQHTGFGSTPIIILSPSFRVIMGWLLNEIYANEVCIVYIHWQMGLEFDGYWGFRFGFGYSFWD